MRVLNIYSYSEFLEHVEDLFAQGNVTGDVDSVERLEATKINISRFKRLNKTARIDPDILDVLEKGSYRWRWTVIAEGWCGDAAQILPYINKVASKAKNIELEVVLRDQHPKLMDEFLTNGSRSIPVLICRDADSDRVIGRWGPRPIRVMEWISNYKKERASYTSSEFKTALHKFYASDKGLAINSDLLRVVQNWMKSD